MWQYSTFCRPGCKNERTYSTFCGPGYENEWHYSTFRSAECENERQFLQERMVVSVVPPLHLNMLTTCVYMFNLVAITCLCHCHLSQVPAAHHLAYMAGGNNTNSHTWDGGMGMRRGWTLTPMPGMGWGWGVRGNQKQGRGGGVTTLTTMRSCRNLIWVNLFNYRHPDRKSVV